MGSDGLQTVLAIDSNLATDSAGIGDGSVEFTKNDNAILANWLVAGSKHFLLDDV